MSSQSLEHDTRNAKVMTHGFDAQGKQELIKNVYLECNVSRFG